MKRKDFVTLLKETAKEWSEDKASRLAAALSYYTVFSLAPLLVIVIAIVGLWFGRAGAQQRITDQVQQLTGSAETAGMISGMIEGASNPGAGTIALIIGLATALFGAAGVFGQLQDALNTIWEVAPKPGRGLMGLVKDRFLSFTMVLGIGFLLLVSLVITAALSALDEFMVGLFPGFELVFQIVNFLISFGVITLLFAMIFKILPEVDIDWQDVWLGAAVTSLLFTVGRMAIGLYLGTRAFNDTYGAAASLIIILLWVYYSAQIMFFGAEFTQVYANRYGKHIRPEPGAITLTERDRAEQGIPKREAVAAAGRAKPAKGATLMKQNHQGGWATLSMTAHPMTSSSATRASLLALTGLLTGLVGFIGGILLTKGNRSK